MPTKLIERPRSRALAEVTHAIAWSLQARMNLKIDPSRQMTHAIARVKLKIDPRRQMTHAIAWSLRARMNLKIDPSRQMIVLNYSVTRVTSRCVLASWRNIL